MLPKELRRFPIKDFFLLIEAKRKRFKDYENVIRFQTALLAEAFVGGGKGSRFVNEAWGGEEVELTREQIKEMHIKRRLIEAQRKKGTLKTKKIG